MNVPVDCPPPTALLNRSQRAPVALLAGRQDLIVGVVLDVALVSLIAPRAVLGSRPLDVKGGGEGSSSGKVFRPVLNGTVEHLQGGAWVMAVLRNSGR